MTAYNYYINLFPWLITPKTLYLTEVKPVHKGSKFSDQQEYILYKHAANIAGKISKIENPIASTGKFLISESPIKVISESIDLFTDGILLKDVNSDIVTTKQIRFSESNSDFFKNFLNRKLDHYMEQAGFVQNGRFYWKPEQISKLDDKFNVKKGIVARTNIFPEGKACLLADYQTHYYSKLSIWDTIQEILKKNKLSTWNGADSKLFGFLINKSVETKYRIWKGFWVYDSIKIAYLDTNKSIKDTLVGNKNISILDYHKLAGNKIEDEDQPVLYVKKGKMGPNLSHVPSLLIECPNMENLKRYNPRASKIAAKISRQDPFSRLFEIEEGVKHLLENSIIGEPKPIAVDISYPQITMTADFIEIQQDKDLLKFYSKGNLAKIPNWKSVHLFFDERQKGELIEFAQGLKSIIKKFKLNIIWKDHPFSTTLKLNGEPFLREFAKFILDETKDLKEDDLVCWAIDKQFDSFYSNLKFELTLQKNISTQQLLIESIRAAINNDSLKTGYINPLFPQIIAKMGGFPYLFQAGITMSNTVFIGLDRFRDSDKLKPSITAAAASFSDHGEYLGASSTQFDALPTDNFIDLEKILTILFEDFKDRNINFSKAIILRDGRTQDMENEINAVFNVLAKFSLKGAFITGNKSSNLRIFKGESLEDIEEIPEQYISILDYYEPNSLVIASTQPIISNGRSLGTARPMLYRIEKHNLTENLSQIKVDLARAITAFTRLNWASFKGNRLPAPLIFADCLANMCALLNSKWTIQLKRPTYL